jgi:ubiquinol-cytochrome c reductase iron-sulfur subunit
MISAAALRRPALRLLPRPVVATQLRGFAHPINVNMIDSEFNAPASHKTLYCNEFIQQSPKEHQEAGKTAKRNPVVSDTLDLMPSNVGDPHNTYGVADWRMVHYENTREPTFPRKPDLSKGELASGANVVRTDVWHDPKEPAITSVAKFSPENFRPKGYAENCLTPTTTTPEGVLDFRTNRLPLNHADRRPWVYFVAASTGFIMTSITRAVCCKLVHGMWPAKDVFAAGIVEVDIRPVKSGQNFVVKWRSKPVFIRKRTPEMIDACRKDDAVVAAMRDPETDAQRCKKPEWLICIGVCTHLGCIPQPDAGNFGGYFCPCHGSHYDFAGRMRQGPAPKNLEVPPYNFIDDDTVKLG